MSSKTGLRKEKSVASYLENNGWDMIKEGTRGPADLVAQKGGKKWAIQIKYTRKSSIDESRLSSKDETKLLQYSNRINAVAVLCLVAQNYGWFRSVKTGKVLMRSYSIY